MATLGLLVLAGWLTEAVLSGDPRPPRPGHRIVAPEDETEGSTMTLEYEVRERMADRMREAADYRPSAPRPARGPGRRSDALRRKLGYGLVRAGLRLLDAPVPRLTREGA